MSLRIAFEQELQLLATVVETGAEGVREASTALVLALSKRRILIEANRVHEKGEKFTLRFFVPLREGFSRLSVKCVITEARDLEKLQYEADITDIDETQRGILADYLTEAKARAKA